MEQHKTYIAQLPRRRNPQAAVQDRPQGTTEALRVEY